MISLNHFANFGKYDRIDREWNGMLFLLVSKTLYA